MLGIFLKSMPFQKLSVRLRNFLLKIRKFLKLRRLYTIGIKKSEELYGSSSGKYQEILGPDEAEKLLNKLGVDEKIIERVCFLVGHHHTYNMIDGLDYQILVEADFLVNAYEDNLSKNAIINVRNKLFKTKTATKMLNDIFALENNQNDKT